MTLDLADSHTFETVLKICFFSYTILTLTISYILRKKGVNIYSTKNTLKIGLAFSPIIILPIWFAPMISPIASPLITRIILSVVLASIGIAVIYGIRYSGSGFRRYFGFEDAEDKRVRAADEQAKKDKEEKQKVRDRIKFGAEGPPHSIIFLRKNLWLLIASIVYVVFSVGSLYLLMYPFNIVFSVLIFFVLLIGCIFQRHMEKKEGKEKE